MQGNAEDYVLLWMHTDESDKSNYWWKAAVDLANERKVEAAEMSNTGGGNFKMTDRSKVPFFQRTQRRLRRSAFPTL